MPAHTTPAHAHAAHFYLGGYPVERVGDFIAAGLRAGEPCVLVLTALHRHAVEKRLHALGLGEPVRSGHGGAYCAIDTHDVLSDVLVGGRLDMQRAVTLMSSLLRPPVAWSGARVRAVGDVAPTLLAAGHGDAALAFENAVDRLAEAHGASVCCAYPMAHFWCEGQPESLIGVCREHASIEFPQHPWAHGFLPPADAARAMSPSSAAAAGRTRS